MHQGLSSLLIIAIALFLSGCGDLVSRSQERVKGRLLFWHSFEGQEAETLNSMLAKYRELYPKINIVDEFFPEEDIKEQFNVQARSGLGPDLMISSYEDMIPMIRVGALENLNDYNLDLSSYLPRPIRQVTLNGNLYGLPFALNTQVLCYNKTKVERPLETLPEIITEAKADRQIAITSNFLDTLWGMEIFRSQSKNTKESNLFDPQAWAHWLEWLRYVQKDPHIILADENSSIDQAFAKGNLAYYVCHSEEISNIQATLGADKLGVATLPRAGNRTAAPLLYTKAIVFNEVSSKTTTKLALQLAAFLTNVEQQTKLALETESLIPVNSKVNLDRRLSPIQAVLYAQSKIAVAASLDYVYEFDNADQIYGEFYYSLVMAGEMSPQEAADKLTQKITEIREKLRQEAAMQSEEE